MGNVRFRSDLLRGHEPAGLPLSRPRVRAGSFSPASRKGEGWGEEGRFLARGFAVEKSRPGSAGLLTGFSHCVPLPRSHAAFSLLELMLALAIFSMVMTAVYSTWTAVLRGARVGNDVAAAAQRSRITARTIEDALLSTVMFQANAGLYTFESDTSGDFAALSFVSRLPPSFPGGGYFGDLVVRRVIFSVVAGRDGTNDLVLQQVPILAAADKVEDEKHTIVLARDVDRFMVEFLGQPGTPTATRNGEWATEWPFTNALPWVVRFTLAFGRPVAGDPDHTKDRTVRTVLLPSIMVPGASSQGSAPPAQQAVPPGGVPGGPLPPPGTQPVPQPVPQP